MYSCRYQCRYLLSWQYIQEVLQRVLSRLSEISQNSSAQERWLCFERCMDSYVVVGRPWEGHLHWNEGDELKGFTHANVTTPIFVGLLGLKRLKVQCLDWVGNDVATHESGHSTVGQGWLPELKCLLPIFHFHDPFLSWCFFRLGWEDQLPCFFKQWLLEHLGSFWRGVSRRKEWLGHTGPTIVLYLGVPLFTFFWWIYIYIYVCVCVYVNI